MSFEEALQVLGLSRSDGAAAVRRAYLRRLKKHKPEQDPEGFRRLRKALETVEEQPWGWRSADERENEDEDAAELPHETSALGSTASTGQSLVSTAAGEVLGPPEVERAEETPRSFAGDDEEEDDDLDAQLYECEGNQERFVVCQEYIRRHPHDYDGYAYGAHELVQAGREEEAATLLREGDALGVPDLLADLVRMLPDLATHEEVERALGDGTPTDLQERAAFKRAHGDLTGAREDLREALQSIEREGGGVYEHRSQLEALLQHALSDDLSAAHTLLKLHQGIIRREGMERRMIQYDDLLVVQTAELLDQWDALEPQARRSLIQMMLQPDDEHVVPVDCRKWRKTIKRLGKHAPALHALAEARATGQPSPTAQRMGSIFSRLSRILLYWFIFRIVLLAAKAVFAD